MIKSFLQDDKDLIDRLSVFCSSAQSDDLVINTVTEILRDIRNRGDTAMLERTLLYDQAKLSPNEIKVSQSELEGAKSRLTSSEKESILEGN